MYRSGFFPKILGILLGLASLGYFAESYGAIGSPGASDVLGIVVVALAVPGELAFALWLLIKGVNEGKWNERALEAERPRTADEDGRGDLSPARRAPATARTRA